MHAFCLESFREGFRWLSLPLLDMLDFPWDLLYSSRADEHGVELVTPGGHCPPLENALAVHEERVPLDAVTELCLLLLGLFFLSHDFDSENWVCEFRWELSPRVSLSDAWVMRRGSPYYPVDNRVVAVRSTSVMLPPFCRVVA
ncbi:hypothetical protein Tco_0633014 [Tanacetum coccineum]